MEDMYEVDVYNGDIMVEGHDGESCYIFRVENEKPILYARWGTGILDKFNERIIMDLDEKTKIHAKSGEIPSFMGEYWNKMLERIQNITPKDLMKVEGINIHIFKKFIEENHEAIEYSVHYGEDDFSLDSNTKPMAFFPDGAIIGEH
jgi:hypothetical protein